MNISVMRSLPALLVGILTFSAVGAEEIERMDSLPGLMPPTVTIRSMSDVPVESDMVIITTDSGKVFRERMIIAQANPQGKMPEPGRGGPPAPDDPKMLKWLYGKLESYLKIEKDQATRFEPIFMDFTASRGRLMREHTTLLHRIIAESENQSVSVKDLQGLSKRYKDIDRQLWMERETFYKKSAGILTERQMVKLIIYEDKVKEDLFHRMRRDRKPSEQGKDNVTPRLFGNPATGK